MIADRVEKLKADWTDKYVVVAADRPELRRFVGATGRVKTVNMSGRALVEFDLHNNIGWYDINPAFLTIVDQPPPKPIEEKATRKAPPKKEAAAASSPLPATATPSAAGVKKLSTADVLAAARAKSAAEAKSAASAKAAAPAEAASPPKPAAGRKLSTAEILAAARGQTRAGGSGPTASPAPPTTEKPQPTTAELLEAARIRKPAAPPTAATAAPPAGPSEPVSPQQAAPTPAAKAAGGLPKSTLEIIAWCRAHDAKG